MNVLVATSRGGGLDSLTKQGIQLKGHVHPGAKLMDLHHDINDPKCHIIPPSQSSTENTHIYILAGTNDITTLTRKHPHIHPYTECIYTETPTETIAHIKRDMAKCADTIRDKGATPIFCTITPLNIEKYNQSLITKNWTRTLTHQDNYNTWQQQIDTIMHDLNEHIIETNNTNNLATPLCHKAIITHHGNKKRGYWRTNWNLLKDGLHGGQKIRKAWAHSISAAIMKNRNITRLPKRSRSSSSEEDIGSPKRSWKSEKRPENHP